MRDKDEENFGTFAYFRDPVKRKEWLRRTGFVDTLALDNAKNYPKSDSGITPPNRSSDTHEPEQSLHSGS
jgi:hypothetical protein